MLKSSGGGIEQLNYFGETKHFYKKAAMLDPVVALAVLTGFARQR